MNALTIVELKDCTIKSVRANLVDGTTRIAFETYFDNIILDATKELSDLTEHKTPVTITLTPRVVQLPFKTTYTAAGATSSKEIEHAE